jgi:hypothetical protein
MITVDALFSPAVIMDAREPSAGMTGEWRLLITGSDPRIMSEDGNDDG